MANAENGDLIAGRYRLQAELGRGGMGTVYRAYDNTLDRQVALKLLTESRLGTEGRARLLREAQMVARLNHPNIVTVFDAGEADGQPFIVMELVEGVSLYQHRPDGLDEILSITGQVCAALEHAHAHEIIHRDLKPENVLIGPSGQVKLMDFGLARSVASRMTEEGTIVGTVFYMAPEQAMGKEIDTRADLYALGVLLYELTTGVLPFEAEDPIAVITQHINAPVVPPRARAESLPAHLDRLILRLLSKDPDERPASAAEVRAALERPESAELAPLEEVTLLDRIVRGRLVGRERELSQARALWNKARAGEGQALLVSGEPGVGKSRLVREVVTLAEVSGGRAALGACYAEGAAPYTPFAQIIRRLLDGLDGDRPDLPDFVLADLFTLAPDLKPYYPQVPENPTLEPKAEQGRIFQNFVTFCERVGGAQPLLLVVDDLHWADSGTVHLLRHLMRGLSGLPLLVVATYREVELSGSGLVHEALQEFGRQRWAARLKLSRLDREQTRALLATLFAAEISDDFLDGIYRETEGNPFFVEEVAKALVESGKLEYRDGEWHRPAMAELEIPQSVMLAIQGRVGKLPQEHQDVLRLAAVLGREFELDTLLAACDQDEEAVVAALEKAEHIQLIQGSPAGRGMAFAFAHALIPAALVEELGSLRARRLHGRAAAALRDLHPDDLEALAHHSVESGDLESGLEYSWQAAQRARQSYALDEAVRFYNICRECAQALGRGEDLARADEALGELYTTTGPYLRAVEHFQRALEHTPSPDERRLLQAKIGNAYVQMGDQRGLDLLETLVEELDPERYPRELAFSLNALGRIYHLRAQYGQAVGYYRRAVELLEPLEEDALLVFVYGHLAGSYQHLTRFPESLEWAGATIALAERCNDLNGIAIGHEFIAENHMMMGNWEHSLEAARRDYELGQKFGSLERQAWACFARGGSQHGLGELSRAAGSLQTAIELAERTDNLRLMALSMAFLARLETDRGNDEAARRLAEESLQNADDLGEVNLKSSAMHSLAYLPLQRGDPRTALDYFGQLGELIAGTEIRSGKLFTRPDHARALLGVGEAERALEVAEEGLAHSREAGARHCQALNRLALGQVHAAQGEAERAEGEFQAAIELLTECSSALGLGQAYYQRGLLRQSLGQTEAARADLEQALEVFRQTGARPDAERAEKALKDLG